MGIKLVMPALFLCALPFHKAWAAGSAPAREMRLHDGWRIEPAAKVALGGATVSTPGFSPRGWHKAVVPSTVLGSLVDDGDYGPDVFAGKNMQSISSAPFAGAWWYRKEFTLPRAPQPARTRLAFDGINYRADVWLNGQQVAAASDLFGAFRRFELDITPYALAGKNALAVKVYPPVPGDFIMGFVDWSPRPADSFLGLWREVRVLRSGPVSLHNAFARTEVDTGTLKSAELTVGVSARNDSDRPVSGELSGSIGDITFAKRVALAAGESRNVEFSPDRYPQLALKNPRLWWPIHMGKPELYRLKLSFKTGGSVSDSSALRFGVRQVSDYITPHGQRGYKINGKPILIRGGGWADDLFLRQSSRRLRAQLDYVKHMGLNAIRLEGFWGEDSELYDDCDELGILIMAGWSCMWDGADVLGKPVDEKYGGVISPEDRKLITASWEDHILWLRSHPSIFVWLFDSDLQPLPDQERAYLAILKAEDPGRPYLASAGGHEDEVSGPSRVKMLGPYDYVPPMYWFVDKSSGGAFGFDTESGPGPAVPVAESMERMLTKAHLWPMDEVWTYHMGLGLYSHMDLYNQAMERRFGKPADFPDYERKAQLLNYDGLRAMYEAFSANEFESTGIIQWMLNSAWPKLWWQLYDYFLVPTGAFYGAQKANRPLHALYDAPNGKLYVVNQTLEERKGLTLEMKILDPSSRVTDQRTFAADAGPNRSTSIADYRPERDGKFCFMDLRLKDSRRRTLDRNFYVLPSQPDVLDSSSTWYTSYTKTFADLTGLASLAPVRLESHMRFGVEGGRDYAEVALSNRSRHVAFAVELELGKAQGGELVAPVFWDDNFVALLPGEKRVLRAYYRDSDAGPGKPALKLRGWNITLGQDPRSPGQSAGGPPYSSKPGERSKSR